MADIIGTIINVKSYLENKECKISVHPQHEAGQEIVLHADREYIIPSFQRELRWNVDNVNTLISDLSRAPVFLGNVILTIKDDHNCEIIDGQQRTTVLILILAWLRKKYRTQIELLSTCNIKNDSFASFQSLVNLEFDKSSVSESEWKALIARENDKFSQLEKVLDIWNSFEKSEILNDRYSASDLVQNIKRSEVNIIASYSNDVTTGIRYFLDVNLKGVRLDTEDIFKAHLFEIDTREETRELWEKVKHSAMLLNVAKDKKDSKRYPLMKILEHFFYCDLYNDPNYAQVKFGEDFSLIETVTLGKHHFYKGSHLIEVIRNRDYMETCLTRTLRAIEIMKEIVESSGPNDSFNSLFLSDKKIDSVDKENCHDLLKKILLEKEVIPKILALKYIITYFDGSNHSKAEYKNDEAQEPAAYFISSAVKDHLLHLIEQPVCVCGTKLDDSRIAAIKSYIEDNFVTNDSLLLEKERDALFNACEKYREHGIKSKNAYLSACEEIYKHVSQLADKKHELTLLKKDIGSFNEEAGEKLIRDIARLEQKKDDATERRTRTQVLYEQAQATLADWESKLAKYSQTDSEGKLCQRKLEATIQLEKVFTSYKEQLLEQKRCMVEDYATEVFREITNAPQKYKGIKIDTDYSLPLELTNGETYQIEPGRTLNPSTGQSKVISLSYIAGLNKSSNYAAPVIIDNPLGLFSDEHRTAITKYLPRFSKQVIFMVSTGDLTEKYSEILSPYVKTKYYLTNESSGTWSKTTIASKEVL